MSAICPVCGQGHIIKDTFLEEFEYKHAVLSVEQSEEYCDACGTLMQTQEMIRKNMRNKVRAQNIFDGLMIGAEIQEFREKYKITQKTAAQLFGGGPTAFAKYEADEIAHNVSMDRLLRLCMKIPHNLLMLAEIAGIELPEQSKRSALLSDEEANGLDYINNALSALVKKETNKDNVIPFPCANDEVFEHYAATEQKYDPPQYYNGFYGTAS